VLQAVREARDVIDRDFAEPLSLDALASAASYSKYHFVRAFAEAYGETPRAYLTRRRIERAKDLLRAANLSVTEVCMLVGFDSLGSFSARFKALVGVAPTEYRAQMDHVPPIPGCFVLMWTTPQSGRSAKPQR
jgi:AraC-like DNA-binding protein